MRLTYTVILVAWCVHVVSCSSAPDEPGAPVAKPRVSSDQGSRVLVPPPPGPHHTAPPSGDASCRATCSLAHHPIDPLDEDGFQEALEQLALEPVGFESTALDTLLFYGRQTEALLRQHGPGPLSPSQQAYLETQLTRRAVTVAFRFVNDAGEARVALAPTRVPLMEKQYLEPRVRDLQPLTVNGTVVRVGPEHLWARF